MSETENCNERQDSSGWAQCVSTSILTETREQNIIKQLNEFVALFADCFKMEVWFCGRKSSLSGMSKKFLTEQLSQHVKLLQLDK